MTSPTFRRVRLCSLPLLVALGAASRDLPAQEADPLRLDRLATDDEIALSIGGDLESRREATAPEREAMTARPFRSLVSDDFSDLEFLRETLDGVRIVQLGESGHGMGETFALKSRLVRFLHEELGFDVLAMESDLYQCATADRGAGEREARYTLFGCAFGVWHVEEVLPLFEHLRATRSTERPLRLAGVDVQPIGTNKDHRPAFLENLLARSDPALADEARTLDSIFLARYAEGGSARRAWMRTHRDSLLEAYGRFEAALAALAASRGDGATAPADSARRDALLARQTVRSIVAYVRQQTAPDMTAYVEARNRGMAENVRFLAEELFPGKKIVVWGHNTHVRYASEAIAPNPEGGPTTVARDMGSWLHDWYGAALYTIGFYAWRGTAVDNAREPYEVAPAPPSHLEHRLARAGYRLAFFDLERQGGWATSEQTLRYNGLHDQEMVPVRQYDALVLIAEVSPPTFLY